MRRWNGVQSGKRYKVRLQSIRSIRASKINLDIPAAVSPVVGSLGERVSYMYVLLFYAHFSPAIVCALCLRFCLRRLLYMKDFRDILERSRCSLKWRILHQETELLGRAMECPAQVSAIAFVQFIRLFPH